MPLLGMAQTGDVPIPLNSLELYHRDYSQTEAMLNLARQGLSRDPRRRP